jgi:hypothetical protein
MGNDKRNPRGNDKLRRRVRCTNGVTPGTSSCSSSLIPSNFDYGAWMEERRQVFLDASVRNPYFKYSLGTTLALLVLAMLYSQAMDRPPARHVDYGGDDDGLVQPRSLFSGCR